MLSVFFIEKRLEKDLSVCLFSVTREKKMSTLWHVQDIAFLGKLAWQRIYVLYSLFISQECAKSTSMDFR